MIPMMENNNSGTFFFSLKVLESMKVIIGQDLNFTKSSDEVWGANARVDRFANLFLHQFEENGLVDVEPVILRPRWRNNMWRNDSVSKRLD
jgi:hypothetical protein